MPDPAPPLRVALVAPPTQTVPPSALGGLDQVRWLADGLAARGHQVTLVGAGLHGFVAERYQVLDTDQHLATRPDPELADAWHAKAAGEIVELLDIDTVSDHTLTGYQPARGAPAADRVDVLPAGTPAAARRAAAGRAARPARPGRGVAAPAAARHLAAVVGRAPPAIPLAEHPWSARHDGPCVYLGPLQPGRVDRAGLALDAAHTAGRPITLAGTGSPRTPPRPPR